MIQMIVGAIISAGTKMIGTVLGEKVIIRVFVALGDKLVKSAKNDVVNDIWQPVKDALNKID